jgi:hypothetical protein
MVSTLFRLTQAVNLKKLDKKSDPRPRNQSNQQPGISDRGNGEDRFCPQETGLQSIVMNFACIPPSKWILRSPDF